MFRDNKRFQLLIIVFLMQFFTVLYISLSYELVALSGNAYRFKIEGYDPIDPLRGRYLAYMINTETVTDDLGEYRGECYITIGEDENGYAYLDKAFKERPQEADYITAERYGSEYYETPFQKYYVNEAIAQKAEELLRSNLSDSYVVIKVNSGKSIVEGLYIGDKHIDNYFE